MTGQKPIQDIVIEIAMKAKAKTFIEHLELKLMDAFFPSNVPFVAYGGTHTTTSNSSRSSDTTTDTSANDDPPVTTNVTVIANGKDTIYGTGMDNGGTVPAALATLQKLPSKLGICTTGNSLDKTDEDDKHMIANNASVKDMEAAIAWSVGIFYPFTSFVGVKVVTDIVDVTISMQHLYHFKKHYQNIRLYYCSLQ